MKTLMLAVVCVLTRALFAASTWTGGDTVSGADWSDETKWEGGAPTAGSEVVFPSAVTATVTDSEGALVASFGKIRLNDAGAKIVFDLAADLVCPAMIQGAGSLEKTGDGILKLDGYKEEDWISYGGQGNYDLRGGFDVLAGGLAWPNGKATAQATYGHVRLAQGATFYVSTTKPTCVGGLSGAGVVTNASSATQTFYVGYPDVDDSDSFDGVIGGAITLYVACDQELRGVDNTFAGAAKVRGGVNGKTGGVLGFMLVGANANEPSSIGQFSDLTPNEGGCYRYLGPGGERTNKRLMLTQDGVHAAVTMDAGPHGGLDFAGEWFNFESATDLKTKSMGELILTGTNLTTAGSFSGKFRAELADTNGCPVSTRITKTGSGIWHLHDHAERLNRGVVAVQEGTLRYDSVEERGVVCSLGLSTVLGGKYYGPWNESKKVDYAFELGAAETQGTFEFAGSNTCATMTRPIALAGDAVLKASGTDNAGINYDGVSVLADGAAVKTLTLAGDSVADNYVGGVRDGAGRLAVVKEDSGKWILRGDQTFSGNLTVKAGTLVVQKKKPFDWFRLTVRESGSETQTTRKIAFYDEDGNWVNNTMTWVEPRGKEVHPPSTTSRYIQDIAWRNIAPNTATYGRTDHLLRHNDDDTFDRLFNGGGTGAIQRYGIGTPTASNESTWSPLVFRMPTGSNPIVAFDFAPFHSGATYYSFKNYYLEGSADGQHWYKVAEDTAVDYSGTSGNSHWIYTTAGYSITQPASLIRKLSDGEGKALAFTCETNDYSVLEHVGAITVAPGATLKAEGDFTPTITRLGVSATTGAGTIDGFALADGATVEVVGDYPGGAFTVPVSFAGLKNVSTATGLTLKVNGRTKSGALTLTESSLTFEPAGLMLILR